MVDEPEITGQEAADAYVKEMADGLVTNLDKELAEHGSGVALGLAFAALSGATAFIAKTMGAAYAIETLDLYADPMR